jgi:excisionase family DNA binding protein
MQSETTPSLVPADAYKVAFTIKEAARASGLSRSLLYLAIARGSLRARKCGARTVILDSELRAFLRKLPTLTKSERIPGAVA